MTKRIFPGSQLFRPPSRWMSPKAEKDTSLRTYITSFQKKEKRKYRYKEKIQKLKIIPTK